MTCASRLSEKKYLQLEPDPFPVAEMAYRHICSEFTVFFFSTPSFGVVCLIARVASLPKHVFQNILFGCSGKDLPSPVHSPTLSYPAHTLSYPALPYPTFPYPTLLYPTLTYPIVPTPYRTLPCITFRQLAREHNGDAAVQQGRLGVGNVNPAALRSERTLPDRLYRAVGATSSGDNGRLRWRAGQAATRVSGTLSHPSFAKIAKLLDTFNPPDNMKNTRCRLLYRLLYRLLGSWKMLNALNFFLKYLNWYEEGCECVDPRDGCFAATISTPKAKTSSNDNRYNFLLSRSSFPKSNSYNKHSYIYRVACRVACLIGVSGMCYFKILCFDM